jgi:integrase
VSTEQLTNNAFRNFIETLPSIHSKRVYKNNLKLYMQYRGVAEHEQLLEGDPRVVQSQIIEYILHLRKQNTLTGRSINTRLSAIQKFYETNDVELRWKKIKSYIGSRKKKIKDRAYTREEIAKMLEKADQRERLVVLLMCSSGMRVGALPLLKIRNLERIDKYAMYKITVYENEDEEYITFCTPECAKSVDSYLEFRQRHGERIKEDAPLVREEFDINDEIHAARPRHLSYFLFRMMVQKLRKKSGVIEKLPKRTQRQIMESHGFRKFFQTEAIKAGMNPLYSEFLLGHKSGGLAIESYLRPTENDLLEGNDKMVGYIGIIDALTINEEHKLRREVQTLKQEVTRFDKMQKQIEELNRRMGLAS